MNHLMKKMRDYVENSNSRFRFQESQIASLKQENQILQSRNERLQNQIKQLLAAQKYVAPEPVIASPKEQRYSQPAPVATHQGQGKYYPPKTQQSEVYYNTQDYVPPKPNVYDKKGIIDHPIPRAGHHQPMVKVRSQGWIPP